MGYEVTDDEVAIILRPVMDEEGKWSMELKTGMTIGKNVSGLAGQASVDAALTMAAFLEYTQDFPEILDDLDDYKIDMLKELYPDYYAEAITELEEQEADYEKDGNVFYLNAWTKTQGNA